MKEKWCKSALTKSRLPGIYYSLNPYVGCQHGCVYCYVPNVLHVDREEWKQNIYAKINLPSILRKEIKVKKRGVVGISTSTDAYQPAEKKYELTRKCLLLLSKHDWPIDILTKSDLVVRDADIIERMKDAKVGFTITTLDEEMRGYLEPYAPSIERRLKALRKLSDRHIFTYVFAGPLFPDIEMEEVKYYMETFIEAGASEIVVDTFHLKEGVMEAIHNALPPEKRRTFIKKLYGRYAEKIISEMLKISNGKIDVKRAF